MPSEVVDLVREFAEGLLRGGVSEGTLLDQLSAWSPTYKPSSMLTESLSVRDRSMFADLVDRLKSNQSQNFCVRLPKARADELRSQKGGEEEDDGEMLQLDYPTLAAILGRCSDRAVSATWRPLAVLSPLFFIL
eukprot:jgi/Mesen1/8585/ME000005S08554